MPAWGRYQPGPGKRHGPGSQAQREEEDLNGKHLLPQVQEQEGSRGSAGRHHEEWPAGHPGSVPGVRRQGVPHRGGQGRRVPGVGGPSGEAAMPRKSPSRVHLLATAFRRLRRCCPRHRGGSVVVDYRTAARPGMGQGTGVLPCDVIQPLNVSDLSAYVVQFTSADYTPPRRTPGPNTLPSPSSRMASGAVTVG